MAHPFFEVTAWPASKQEAIGLYNELRAAITQSQRISDYYHQSAEGLPSLTLPSPADVLWNEALRNLAAGGGVRTLCELIKQAYAGNERLVKAIEKIENAKSVVEKKLLPNNRIMLDRLPLREAISRITPHTDYTKILLVHGDKNSGKSYGYHLFEEMALEQGAIPLFLYAEIVPTFEELLNELYSPFGTKVKREKQKTTETAWYQAICTQLQTLAHEQNKFIWIAMDDLGTDEKDVHLVIDEIRQFFDQFALQMGKYLTRRHFRLMLIHYIDEPKKFKEGSYIKVQEFKEIDIQQTEIEQLLEEWRARSGKLLTDQMIKAAAVEVLAAADQLSLKSGAACRLKRIHTALTDKLQKLESQ